MNRKGQLAIPIITLAIIFIAFLFIAPFVMKIFNSVMEPLQPVLGNQSSEAGLAVAAIDNTFGTWWDYAIVFGFLTNIILFLVSAFLVDTHPAFAAVFLLAGFFTVIFAPSAVEGVEKIWDSPDFTEENNDLPITRFFLDYYGAILTGVMVLGGIILYARIRTGGRGV